MIDKNKLLDEVTRREKTGKAKRILKYLGLALVLGTVYSYSEYKNYDRVKFSKQLSGEIQSIEKSMDKHDASETVFVIKLENDKMVKIPKNRFVDLAQGQQIKVLRQELESGRLRYSIVINR